MKYSKTIYEGSRQEGYGRLRAAGNSALATTMITVQNGKRNLENLIHGLSGDQDDGLEQARRSLEESD